MVNKFESISGRIISGESYMDIVDEYEKLKCVKTSSHHVLFYDKEYPELMFKVAKSEFGVKDNIHIIKEKQDEIKKRNNLNSDKEKSRIDLEKSSSDGLYLVLSKSKNYNLE